MLCVSSIHDIGTDNYCTVIDMRELFPDSTISAIEECLLDARLELRRMWATSLVLAPLSAEKRWHTEGATPADVRCDEILRSCLASLSPSIPVCTEETPRVCTGGPALLIDPLDATHNAVAGFPSFSSSVAYWDGEDYVFGWVYDISRDVLYSAHRGSGAYVQSDFVVRRLRTASGDSCRVDALAVALMRPRQWRSDPFKMGRLFCSFDKVRYTSCSSLELCWVASGVLDAFIDSSVPGNERTCDIAGAAVVLREAGGGIFLPDGRERKLLAPGIDAIEDREALLALGNTGMRPVIVEFLTEVNCGR